MNFDTIHLQVPYLSECQFNLFWLQEDQEAEEEEKEEEHLQQPVFGIGGSWQEWDGYPDIMQWVKAYYSC